MYRLGGQVYQVVQAGTERLQEVEKGEGEGEESGNAARGFRCDLFPPVDSFCLSSHLLYLRSHRGHRQNKVLFRNRLINLL